MIATFNCTQIFIILHPQPPERQHDPKSSTFCKKIDGVILQKWFRPITIEKKTDLIRNVLNSEWRTFSNDKDSKDKSRVGDVENRLLSSSGSDLSTMIGPMGNGQMSEEYSKFNNRRHVNSTDRIGRILMPTEFLDWYLF